jgi:hypothetical protein
MSERQKFYLVVEVEFVPGENGATVDPAHWGYRNGLDRMFNDVSYGCVKGTTPKWTWDEKNGLREIN